MVDYADALVKTKPLRSEVARLEAELAETQKKYDDAMALVDLTSADGIATLKGQLTEQEAANRAAEAEAARLEAALAGRQGDAEQLAATRWVMMGRSITQSP
eukprot:SAG22_NODE_225_length_14728_cov_58.742361_6_plen_102_part_00